MSKTVKYAVLVAILVVLVFGLRFISFYSDWLWFREVGYTGVFMRYLTTKAILSLVGGLAFFAFVGSNLWLARRGSTFPRASYDVHDLNYRFRQRAGLAMHQGIGWLLLAGLVVASVFAALEAGSHWSQYLGFAKAVPFGTKDPLFGNDISFYVFRLPFWRYLYSWSIVTLILTTIAVAAVYITDRAVDFLANSPRIAPHVRAHLLGLLGVLLVIRALGYRLEAYDLLYSTNGAAFGAMYTDIHARLPIIYAMLVFCLMAAALVFYSIRSRGWKLPAIAVGGLILISFIAGLVYPGFVQSARVKPNELEMERPYIQRTIAFTRQAYGLDSIKLSRFAPMGDLTAADIERNQATINNIRLWDYRPLSSTYESLQAIRPYYSFKGPLGIDVDRYGINGQYRQVMLAARELRDTEQTSASWLRNHLQYTHGYGMVMSPASEVNAEGLPVFYISQMPLVSSTSITVTKPQIYYGEASRKYVVVRTTQREFDYPRGEAEETTFYSGRGGVPMGSILRRAALAINFGDPYLLLSNAIRPDSRLMWRRQINERMRAIAPFLIYDHDPYLVVAGGRLYWVQDAYTATSAYPYSEPYEMEGVPYRVNYARNSVKAVVDAYDGTVSFYAADTRDPILRTYRRIFAGLFKDMNKMPVDLRSHIRYPEDIFRLQAEVYATYHMTNPSVFYRKEDVWDFPVEVKQPGKPELEPYYVIMRLPGETQEELMLIRPFTPPGRPNMIAWMAAKCDPAEYGRMVVYQFPELPYGPEQIEARIDQDASISQQLSLWDTGGSSVVRGNLLVIPVEDSFLYVEPIYLQATSENQIPELKRVIVANRNRVVMASDLNEALALLFGAPSPGMTRQPTPGRPAAPTTAPAAAGDMKRLISQANQAYDRALAAQKRGDWAAYGDEIKRLETTLRELRQRSQ